MDPNEQPEPRSAAQPTDAVTPDSAWRFVVTTLLVVGGVAGAIFVGLWLGGLLWVAAYGIATRIPFPGQGKRDKDIAP